MTNLDTRKGRLYTQSQGAPWPALRRVHFFISDLIALYALQPLSIGVFERRILDALAWALYTGHAQSGVNVSTLCNLIQTRPKAQTVNSALNRLQARGLVQRTSGAANVRPHVWELTEMGHTLRSNYNRRAEGVLRDAYRESPDPLRRNLVERGQATIAKIDEQLIPVVYRMERVEGRHGDREQWATLRRMHFYINDRIFNEIEPMGAGQVARRVLDAISFARSRGAVQGVPVTTICSLGSALERSSATPALSRMLSLGWVAKSSVAVRRREPEPESESGRKTDKKRRANDELAKIFWSLTPKGSAFRDNYKQIAEDTIQEVYILKGSASGSESDLLHLAQIVEEYRSQCLESSMAVYWADSPLA